MSDIIRLLPDSVANQIAAGEVIQRPASVIKELVENAVDAKATEINIVIRDAGKTLIQVSDNGIGMSETDARMAFERHATSKIRQATDLFSLHSMGFRGEALPSVCAISEVELKTKPEDAPLGTRLVIEASKVKVQEPMAAERGTVIAVKKLFFNVPARRKFLKSDSVELSNIMREFERLALVNHTLRLSIDTGTRKIELRPGTLRQRIEEIWKGTLSSDHLLPVNIDTPIVKIEGFISRPEFARRRNPLQYMIVNGRNMRHPYFHKAVMSCYENLIAQGTQPNYFLVFTVEPDTIDVNIHPTKNEIKFENENAIWPILTQAVKTSLGKFSAVPSIDFNSDALDVRPLPAGEMPTAPDMGFRSDYNPFEEMKRRPVNQSFRPTPVSRNWEDVYMGIRTDDAPMPGGRTVVKRMDTPSSPVPGMFDDKDADCGIGPICIQFGLKYIVTTQGDGLLVIDQHRAHVKILYEEYMRRSANMEIVTQTLMFPETVSLDSAQVAALEGVGENLKALGFRLEYLSETDWQINAVPSMIQPHEAKDVLLRVLDSVTEDSVNYGNEQQPATGLREKLALVMARSGAIRRGVKLSARDMEDLIARLFALPDPALTPNGNPVFTVLTDAAIATLLQ